MGKPIEKNLPPKLEVYIQKKQLVTMEELLTIYEWPEKLLNKELKLSLQQKVEKLHIQKAILEIKNALITYRKRRLVK